MVDKLEIREKYESLDYSELIKARDTIFKSLMAYERSERQGLRSFEDWSADKAPDMIYKDNLEKLTLILEIMNSRYDRNTLMINVKNPDEQLVFIRNVIWSFDMSMSDEFRHTAIKMLNDLIKDGNADAINIQGAMYFEGVGVEEDKKKAFRLYRKAAKLGSSLAMSNVGYCYLDGIGTKQNYELAFNNFSMAVHHGEWDAFSALGDMYLNGIYVPRNEKMAFDIYDKCYKIVPHDPFNDAYPAVLLRIGECFMNGTGVEVNLDTSYRLLMEAKRIYEIQTEECNYYSFKALKRVEIDLEEVKSLIELM